MADKDLQRRQTLAKRWSLRLDKEEKAHKKFREQAKEAEKAARDDDENKKHAFNIQWANCKILRSAVYGRRPVPDVRRRYQKPNPEEKELARMVERALEFNIDTGGFDWPAQAVVKDYIESGLGVPRLIMDVVKEPLKDETGQPIMDETGEPLEQIVAQEVGIEHIPWKHFCWEPGKSWEAVDWVAFKSYQPQKQVEAEYGVEIKGSETDDKREAKEYADEICLYEIWDKRRAKIYVLAKSHPEILEEREDTLGLKGFYPCPRPLFANLKSDELIPKPDYELVKSPIEELNRITQRKKEIVAQIKVRGYYDSSIKGMQRLMDAKDGTLQPVDNLPGSIDGKPGEGLRFLPIGEFIATARELESQAESVKNTIYEVIGIADIIRGSSKAQETAAAQNLKGQWANVRLSEKSGEVARLWRDMFRMMAEVICEHFRPEILTLQTGVQLTPNMVAMMRSDIGRTFAIDIETDSTLAQDDFEDRQQAMELVEMLLSKMEQVIPGVQAGLLPITFVQETLLLVISKYKHGKQLEDAVMELTPHLQSLQQFQQQLQQAQQAIMERDQQLQQAGQQLQGMQQALGKYNERDERRKDAETRARIAKDRVDAQAQDIENQIVASQHGVDTEQKFADLEFTEAQTDKIRAEMMRPTWGS